MEMNDYQKHARGTAMYPNIGNNLVYPVLGLNGEAGEVAEKLKKIIRDEQGEISEEKKEEIKKELGDVFWYLANCASELDFTLQDVAECNLRKLWSRKERGKLTGSGDNR